MNHPKTDIFYDLAYVSLCEQMEHGKGEIFHYCDEFGSMCYPFIKRPLPGYLNAEGEHDLISPYGYGGPLILECEAGFESVLVDRFTARFTEYCFDNRVISEFVRFHPILGNDQYLRDHYDTRLYSQNVVCDLTLEMDVIWSQFDHKVRKNVNRAIKNQLTVLVDKKGEHLKDFLEIYYDTMGRRTAREWYYFPEEYFRQLNSTLEDKYVYFFIMSEGVAISAELVLLGSSGIVHSFLGGTLANYFALRPNDLIKYEIIKWAKAHGYKCFLLGGGVSVNDGIYRYKLSFCPNGSVPFFLARKIYSQARYDELVEHARRFSAQCLDENFFPLYRAIRG